MNNNKLLCPGYDSHCERKQVWNVEFCFYLSLSIPINMRSKFLFLFPSLSNGVFIFQMFALHSFSLSLKSPSSVTVAHLFVYVCFAIFNGSLVHWIESNKKEPRSGLHTLLFLSHPPFLSFTLRYRVQWWELVPVKWPQPDALTWLDFVVSPPPPLVLFSLYCYCCSSSGVLVELSEQFN